MSLSENDCVFFTIVYNSSIINTTSKPSHDYHSIIPLSNHHDIITLKSHNLRNMYVSNHTILETYVSKIMFLSSIDFSMIIV